MTPVEQLILRDQLPAFIGVTTGYIIYILYRKFVQKRAIPFSDLLWSYIALLAIAHAISRWDVLKELQRISAAPNPPADLITGIIQTSKELFVSAFALLALITSKVTNQHEKRMTELQRRIRTLEEQQPGYKYPL